MVPLGEPRSIADQGKPMIGEVTLIVASLFVDCVYELPHLEPKTTLIPSFRLLRTAEQYGRDDACGPSLGPLGSPTSEIPSLGIG